MVQAQIQKNFAQADIYFQTLNVVNIAQSALMDVSFIEKTIWQRYLGNLGIREVTSLRKGHCLMWSGVD